MSTKRLNEAIAALKATAHRFNDDGLLDLGLAAEEELRAIERTAKVLESGGWTSELRDSMLHEAADVMSSIAKDAP